MKSAHRLLCLAALLLMVAGMAAAPVVAQDATPTRNCPAATPEDNLAVVQRFFEEGVNQANLDVFAEVAALDVVYHGATVADESGLEALQRIYGEALSGFSDLQYTVLTSVAGTDAVATRYQVTGTHTGEFRGIAPSGSPIAWTHALFARVECGLITEMWAEVSQLDRLQQFGLLATEGPAATMAGTGPRLAATPTASDDAASCAPASPEENIAVADRVRAEVYNSGDLDAMPEIFAEGYLHGSANGPDAVGIEEGAQRIGGFLTALPDLDWTFDEVIAGGNRVAARWTTRGTHDGDLLGFAATGNPVVLTGISFFTIDCGKVVSFQTEMDAAGLLEQVGAPVS